ncbi:MAG TPA: DUF3592 domain-containing protein [Victivallales bacterium]|mgnify:CR=1 FL=1|nr:DUF3592 domain-containing protein [Victivallales bacterium]
MGSRRKQLLYSKFLLIVGLLISGFGLVVLKRASVCGKWRETDAVIIGAYARDLPVPENKHYNRLTPDIVYEYEASNGKTYFSNRISYMESEFFPRISDNYYSGNFEEIKRFLEKYPVESKVKAYYDPEKPSESVLDRGLKMPVFMPLMLGLLLLYTSLHMYLFGVNGLLKRMFSPKVSN